MYISNKSTSNHVESDDRVRGRAISVGQKPHMSLLSSKYVVGTDIIKTVSASLLFSNAEIDFILFSILSTHIY